MMRCLNQAFPKENYDGTMDFVCQLQDGHYVLVEMQVMPYEHWDRRALAYVAACYGNQLREGDDWKQLKRVIGINILGGGMDEREHWKDRPNQFMRHYKLQEQLNHEERYIDGIEIVQYSIMHAPEVLDTQEKQDWMTFLRKAHFMSEKEAVEQIKTPAVLQAFELARIDKLPKDVKETYQKQRAKFDQHAEFTEQEVKKGRAEGEAIGRAEGEAKGEAKGKHAIISQLLKNFSAEQVASMLECGIAEVQAVQN